MSQIHKHGIKTLYENECKYPFVPIRGEPINVQNMLVWMLSDKYFPSCYKDAKSKDKHPTGPLHNFDLSKLSHSFFGRQVANKAWSEMISMFSKLDKGTFQKLNTPIPIEISDYKCSSHCKPSPRKFEYKCTNCFLPKVDESAESYCEIFGDQRSGNILFVGDSLSQTFYQSFMNKMYKDGDLSCAICNERFCDGSVLTKIPCSQREPDKQPHAVFVRNDRLSYNSRIRTSKEQNFYEYPWKHILHRYNISLIVMNRGAHFVGTSDLLRDLSSLFRKLAQEHPNIDIIWRNTPYGHLNFTDEPLKQAPPMGNLKMNHYNEFMRQNDAVKKLLAKYFPYIPYLDVASSTILRADLHRDPLNYCIPGPVDLWVTMFIQLLTKINQISKLCSVESCLGGVLEVEESAYEISSNFSYIEIENFMNNLVEPATQIAMEQSYKSKFHDVEDDYAFLEFFNSYSRAGEITKNANYSQKLWATPTIVHLPCFEEHSFGNSIGQYFNKLACTIESGGHFLAPICVAAKNSIHNRSYNAFFRELPQIVVNQFPANMSTVRVNALNRCVCTKFC